MASTTSDARESRPSGVPLLVMEPDDLIRKLVMRTLKETSRG